MRETDIQTDRQADKQTDRHKQRERDRQTERQTERQRETERKRETARHRKRQRAGVLDRQKGKAKSNYLNNVIYTYYGKSNLFFFSPLFKLFYFLYFLF